VVAALIETCRHTFTPRLGRHPSKSGFVGLVCPRGSFFDHYINNSKRTLGVPNVEIVLKYYKGGTKAGAE
jgi:hypothetical protein